MPLGLIWMRSPPAAPFVGYGRELATKVLHVGYSRLEFGRFHRYGESPYVSAS
jgi:hypothetical protein